MSWGGGYVTDLEYITGYYRQQSASQIMLAGLLGGVDTRLPGGGEDVHYLELGCGHGMNAVLTAASNPGWRVTAVDYNPAHIAAGRALAHAAGLENVTLLEADFADLANGAIPAADIVSMHGVWSWVSPAVRAAIVRLLAAVVAPGGLVHLSYNALPAWQGALGMQRLIREAGQRAGGRSDKQVLAGMDFAREMLAAEAQHLRTGLLPAALLERRDDAQVGYLAHEYMNAHWSPCFHADVAEALADAKLDYAASANVLENFNDLMLSEPQRALLARHDDPVMRELIKDTFMPRQLRHDVFVRGPRRLSAAARDAVLSEMTLALTGPAGEFVFEMEMPAGKAALGEAFRPMVAALDAGPMRVDALLALTPGHSNPAELAAVLVGTGQGIIVPRPGAAQSPEADRLNRVLGGRVTSLVGPEVSCGLASIALGAALPTSRMGQFVCARILAGDAPGEGWYERLCGDVPAEKHDTLRGIVADAVEKRVMVLKRLGMVAETSS